MKPGVVFLWLLMMAGLLAGVAIVVLGAMLMWTMAMNVHG